ncbi:MAG: efflux RND transporter periplasmic adaptor subunit [Gammaproteobacteria bacterium]
MKHYRTISVGVMALLAWVALPVLAADSAVKRLTELDCVIEPHTVVEISSPSTGVINSISVDKSDVVKKGQILVELDSKVEQAAVAEARVKADMHGAVQSKLTSLAYAKRKLASISGLYASGAASRYEEDESATAVTLATLELQQAKEDHTLAELELKHASETLKLRTVRSPLSGVVVDRYKSVGEYSGNKPILKLAAIDPLRVEVIAPAALFGRLNPGMKAEVITEANPGDKHPAVVSIVGKVVDAASGTFDVRLNLPNPDYRIAGGSKCTVRFLGVADVAEATRK